MNTHVYKLQKTADSLTETKISFEIFGSFRLNAEPDITSGILSQDKT